MTPFTSQMSRPLQSQLPWAICCVLTLFAPLSSRAQSAASFQSQPPAANETNPKRKTPAAAPSPVREAGPVSDTPSRNVSDQDFQGYVDSLTAIFTIRKRATDPFGLLQDPDAKPIVKPSVAKNSRRAAPIQATPFSEIVRLIKVSTIMPAEKRFLIGTRSVKQGERIPLSFRGRNLNVEVSSVSSRSIRFRNLENGETAELPLNLLPVGMTPGTRGITAPGMVPDQPNAPIQLDTGGIPMDPAQNR